MNLLNKTSHNTEYEEKIKFFFMHYGIEFHFLPKFLPFSSFDI